MSNEHPEIEQEPSAEQLFTRGRNSMMDLVKLAMTLATGAVAAFFLGLTRTAPPTLSQDERCWGLVALVLMVCSVGSGLAAWAADATFYGAWGWHVYNQEDEKKEQPFRRKMERWRQIRFRLAASSVILFFVGILAASGYLYSASEHRVHEAVAPRSKP